MRKGYSNDAVINIQIHAGANAATAALKVSGQPRLNATLVHVVRTD